MKSQLAPGQIALGRHHAYHLFSQLYLQGIQSDLLPYLQAVPELAASAGETIDLDQAGAEHHRLFGLNLFPFESIFLDSSGLLGGPVSQRVLHSYQALQYQPDTSASSPDHIGHEIGLLAHLCQLEADSWQNAQVSRAKNIQKQQIQFMQTHLYPWLLPLVTTIQQHNMPFYAALASITWELTCSHYVDLVKVHDRPDIEGDLGLPALPTILEDEKTGLKEIASYLLTPAYSGVFLSGEILGSLAREQELPRGFGGRQQVFLNLMRAAVQYEMLPAMLDDLIATIERWQVAYRRCIEEFPLLASFAKPWSIRTSQTIQNLQQMKMQSSFQE